MATHWTYKEPFDPNVELEQGDILLPTEDLDTILSEVHPHFSHSKYHGFIVLTQSCDLLRRDGVCAARYINLAVIRQLDGVLTALLDTTCDALKDGVYLAESKIKAKQLLSRVFNQNEQHLGLFYLHSDADAGISAPCVAMLRVSVALKVEHYDVMRSARHGQLTAEFRNKLAWLVGNIYSRVGTPDWADNNQEQTMYELRARMLDKALWVPIANKKAAEKDGVNIDDLPREVITETLEKYRPRPRHESALHAVKKVINVVAPGLPVETVTQLLNRLENDAVFRAAFKRPEE